MTAAALSAYYPAIRRGIETAARNSGWPDFERQVARHLTDTRLPVHALLPLASARSAGGDPRAALSVSVACCFLIIAMRWLDDAADRDRDSDLWNDVGPARTANMAACALNMAWSVLTQDRELPAAVLRAFSRGTVAMALGQDLDLRGGVAATMQDYWHLMRCKTGSALALACEAGALAARPDRPDAADACARFGEHAGLLMQILDDLDGSFRPDGLGDLALGKATLPVLYGLATQHAARGELADIVRQGRMAAQAGRVKEILEAIDTREFLVCCAFDERQNALACLDQVGGCPQATEDLRAFADLLLADWEQLLPQQNPAEDKAMLT